MLLSAQTAQYVSEALTQTAEMPAQGWTVAVMVTPVAVTAQLVEMADDGGGLGGGERAGGGGGECGGLGGLGGGGECGGLGGLGGGLDCPAQRVMR